MLQKNPGHRFMSHVFELHIRNLRIHIEQRHVDVLNLSVVSAQQGFGRTVISKKFSGSVALIIIPFMTSGESRREGSG